MIIFDFEKSPSLIMINKTHITIDVSTDISILACTKGVNQSITTLLTDISILSCTKGVNQSITTLPTDISILACTKGGKSINHYTAHIYKYIGLYHYNALYKGGKSVNHYNAINSKTTGSHHGIRTSGISWSWTLTLYLFL